MRVVSTSWLVFLLATCCRIAGSAKRQLQCPVSVVCFCCVSVLLLSACVVRRVGVVLILSHRFFYRFYSMSLDRFPITIVMQVAQPNTVHAHRQTSFHTSSASTKRLSQNRFFFGLSSLVKILIHVVKPYLKCSGQCESSANRCCHLSLAALTSAGR